jgi:hypothetical protein
VGGTGPGQGRKRFRRSVGPTPNMRSTSRSKQTLRVKAPARRVTDDGMDNTQGKPMTDAREFQDKRRLSEIASGARKKLREFADLPSFDQGVQLRANMPPLCWCFPADRKVIIVIRKLGFIFGVGAHVMATKFDVDDDGSISSDELNRFREEGAALVQKLTDVLTQHSVVLTLLLGIFCSLLVLNPGTAPYEDVESHRLPTPFAYATTDDVTAAGDAAQYLFGGHHPAAMRLRFIAYICECVFLWLGFASSASGLCLCFMSFNQVTGLPTLFSKVELILAKPNWNVGLSWLFITSCYFLVFSLIAVSARCSAVMFLCACGAGCLIPAFHIRMLWESGLAHVLMHQEAERVFSPVSAWSEADIRQAFHHYDANNSGRLDSKELRPALRALGLNVDNSEAIRVLQDHDENGNGLMEFDEFARMVHTMQEIAQRVYAEHSVSSVCA